MIARSTSAMTAIRFSPERRQAPSMPLETLIPRQVRAIITGDPKSKVPSGFMWNPSAFSCRAWVETCTANLE